MDYDISEDPTPLRSKAWSYYLVLFVAVIPVWSSVPLAWIFTTYSLIVASYSTLFYVALCEVSHRDSHSSTLMTLHRSSLASIIFISLTTYLVARPDQEILKKFKLPIYAY